MANTQLKTLEIDNQKYDLDATWLDGKPASDYLTEGDIKLPHVTTTDDSFKVSIDDGNELTELNIEKNNFNVSSVFGGGEGSHINADSNNVDIYTDTTIGTARISLSDSGIITASTYTWNSNGEDPEANLKLEGKGLNIDFKSESYYTGELNVDVEHIYFTQDSNSGNTSLDIGSSGIDITSRDTNGYSEKFSAGPGEAYVDIEDAAGDHSRLELDFNGLSIQTENQNGSLVDFKVEAAQVKHNGNKLLTEKDYITAGQKDGTTLGTHATAEGTDTTASAHEAHAEGQSTKATGKSAHAEGYLAEAVGDGAHAEGHKTLAQGDFSHAQGNQTQALGSGSAAAGYKTTAGYDMQFVIGHVNDNNESNLFEIGNGLPYYKDGNTNTSEIIDELSFKFNSFEVDKYGVAKSESFATKSTILNRDTLNIYDEENQPVLVPGSVASGLQSVAFGESSEASGRASFAQGLGVKATETNQAVFGKYNADDPDALFIIGNGDATTPKNAFTVMTNGTIQAPNIQQAPDKVKDGFTFKNKNANAAALDAEVKKWNDGTELVPYGAKPGKFAAAFGGKSAAIGKRSLAEGTTTIAKGDYSHAEGDNSVTLGGDSHAEGYSTVAYGYASHAEGGSTQAKGSYSHAEGYFTVAQGSDSHAEGANTVATGHASHAGGHYSNAEKFASFAHGDHVTASVDNQVVFGKYNVQDSGALFIIGNGTSGSDRKNAFVVSNDGVRFNGKNLLIEGDPITVSSISISQIQALFS